ncbi:patatin-like phospholipase family protein [Sorangium sp. So ce1153]|uniref:patatin-like phospholipase family protein n=1 Tax=Sorangium sp. So ce1153 TaxID=3133333 RepID=UPI003F614604
MVNILSMDGGPGPLIQLDILLELERRRSDNEPSFLGQVDLFAGSSDGALMSLYLAQALTTEIEAGNHEVTACRAREIINGCIAFSEELASVCCATRGLGAPLQLAGSLLELAMWMGKPRHKQAKFYAEKRRQLFEHLRDMRYFPNALWEMKRFLTGQQPFLKSERVKEVLARHFTDRTLGSLRKHVAVVSFDTKAWSTRVFRNFWSLSDEDGAMDEEGAKDRERDQNLSLVDVAMCTASLPVVMPVFGGQDNYGYLDGIFSANNPVMAATSLAIRHLKVPIDQLRVLSLGVTQTAEEANIEHRGGLLALLALLAVDDRDARLAFMPMKASKLAHYLFSSDAREAIQGDLCFSGIGAASWGWLDYLRRPTLLANLLVHGTGTEEACQCKRILGDRFHRFAPRINVVRAMFRLMVLRLPVSKMDLPWNAIRGIPNSSHEPLSADEKHNVAEHEKLRQWLDDHWWPERPTRSRRAPPAQA